MRFAVKISALCVFVIFLISCATSPPPSKEAAAEQDRLEAQILVDKSQFTFNNVVNDPNMGPMRDLLQRAKGVFIMAQRLKGAFVIGAEGGSAVLVERKGNTNNWTGPAFYKVVGGSIGLQAGGEDAEIVLLIMSDRGIAAFTSDSFKLGVDVGVAVGPMGAGASAATANLSADILSFAKTTGLYGGVALSGAVVTPTDKLNHAYYGKPVKPPEILVKGLKSPHAIGLLNAVAVASGETAQPKAKQAPQ